MVSIGCADGACRRVWWAHCFGRVGVSLDSRSSSTMARLSLPCAARTVSASLRTCGTPLPLSVAGKGLTLCLCVCYSDTRLGIQAQTVATDFQKVFKLNDRTFVGLAGLATDVQSVCVMRLGLSGCGCTRQRLLALDGAWKWCLHGHDECAMRCRATTRRHETLEYRKNIYKLKEERDLTPKTTAHLLESMLYARRFAPWFVEPVVAGLQGEDNKPFVYASDLLGAGLVTDDFVVSGTCTENMYGMCESLYKPDMVRPRLASASCRWRSQSELTATCRVRVPHHRRRRTSCLRCWHSACWPPWTAMR